MKKFSIKTRVTIWYVSFLVLLVLLIFASLLYSSNQLIQNNIKGDLTSVVEDSIRDVTVENGRLEIDDDMVSYRDGVYLLVYKENNFIVTGSLPAGIKKEIPFISDTVRKISDNGRELYVYDHLINAKGIGDVWIRGVAAADLEESDPAISFMIKLFLILLPLLILLAVLGGYYITKKAFRPVSQITDTAGMIGESQDLSCRTKLASAENTKDEIYHLAATFDRMLDRLEASFETEKQFSNDASHELRTPISVIMAQCEYALKDTTTQEEAQSALEVILGQSKKMSALISQLLTLARADQGTQTLEFEELNISEIISMVSLEQEELAACREMSILQDIEPEIFALVDETLLIRVYINLLSNSMKYGRKGGHIKVTLHREEGCIVSRIMDDGIGISPEDLPKIWDRFYQVNPSRSDENSMGLGLSMVKWIVSAHGGTITVDSCLGKGTQFTIRLPQYKEEKNERETT